MKPEEFPDRPDREKLDLAIEKSNALTLLKRCIMFHREIWLYGTEEQLREFMEANATLVDWDVVLFYYETASKYLKPEDGGREEVITKMTNGLMRLVEEQPEQLLGEKWTK